MHACRQMDKSVFFIFIFILKLATLQLRDKVYECVVRAVVHFILPSVVP